MTKITYDEAYKGLEQIRLDWIELQKKIEDKGTNKEAIGFPHEIRAIVVRENEISSRIKETWPEESIEKTTLRTKYREAHEEYVKAENIARAKLGVAWGMMDDKQRATATSILEKAGVPVAVPDALTPVKPKITRLIIQTTEKASLKTHEVLKKTMKPSFEGSNEAKRGEYTVTLEEA